MQIKRMKGYGQCFVCRLLLYRNRNPYRQKAVHRYVRRCFLPLCVYGSNFIPCEMAEWTRVPYGDTK